MGLSGSCPEWRLWDAHPLTLQPLREARPLLGRRAPFILEKASTEHRAPGRDGPGQDRDGPGWHGQVSTGTGRPLGLGLGGDLMSWATAWLRGWGRKGHEKRGPWDFGKAPPHPGTVLYWHRGRHSPPPPPSRPAVGRPLALSPWHFCHLPAIHYHSWPREGHLWAGPRAPQWQSPPSLGLTPPSGLHGGFINCLY